jgi:hypothetical protein
MSFANKVFAIRPIEFHSNEETKRDNKFMKDITNSDLDIDLLGHNVKTEFDLFVKNI